MSNKEPICIAIAGATGVVGQTIVRVLEERRFPVSGYIPIATEASSGADVEAFGRAWPVQTPAEVDFTGTDIAFFTAGAPLSKKLVPRAIEQGCRVVDNTTAFRMEKEVPLVVPEINGSLVKPDTKLVACPNCTAIVLVMSLAPILRAAPIHRVVVTSFQSVSGAGREALSELDRQTVADTRHEETEIKALPKQIAFNCIPLIGDTRASGYTKEEEKITEETQKILEQPGLHVVPTAVRVPTRVGHALSVNVELGGPLDIEGARKLWKHAPGVEYTDDIPTPLDVAGDDTVVVGRLRRDLTRPHALTYWAVGDNLRKGAATNSVQIAELFSQ
ncbi:MAG: aspartate-semialdehyde dehydrogenase [Candidatus Latescibacterota bacterium]|nr:MAG: aspartate-semialdehyde dehydrogenase [Candidatus Latescibacterota bacterium]